MSLLQTDISDKLRLNPTTANALAEFARRRDWLLSLRTIAIGFAAFVAAMLVVALCDHLWLLSDSLRWGLSLVAYTVTLVVVWWVGWRHADRNDVRRIARQIETADPRFKEQLLSTVELAKILSSRLMKWLMTTFISSPTTSPSMGRSKATWLSLARSSPSTGRWKET
jgi:hypothetical protein